MASPDQHYVGQLLTPVDESSHRDTVRMALVSMLESQSDIEIIKSTGDLIEYIRDNVLSSLAAIRRTAAHNAKLTMTPGDISTATGLSKATVSRLLTESRNY